MHEPREHKTGKDRKMKYEVAYAEFLVEANPVGAAVDGDATWKIADTEPGKKTQENKQRCTLQWTSGAEVLDTNSTKIKCSRPPVT